MRDYHLSIELPPCTGQGTVGESGGHTVICYNLLTVTFRKNEGSGCQVIRSKEGMTY